MGIATYIALIPVAYTLINLIRFTRNYLKIRNCGLPLVFSPIDQANLFWIIFAVPLDPYLSKYLPYEIYSRIQTIAFGWEFRDNGRMFDRFGDTFILVATGNNELHTRDPDAGAEILKRYKEFYTLGVSATVMATFGQNLLSSDGDTWSRQRRIIAPNLNERISSVVFSESRKQTLEMMHHISGDTTGFTRDITKELKPIAINVLGKACYGESRPWKKDENDPYYHPLPGFHETFFSATLRLVENFLLISIIPTKILLLPLLPASVKAAGQAKKEFPILLRTKLEDERRLAEASSGGTGEKTGRNNVVSMLLRLLDQVSAAEKSTSIADRTSKDEITDQELVPSARNQNWMSPDEVNGNLWLFTIAGFDTTANTMSYGVLLMAAYPEIQEWVAEEVKSVIGSRANEPNLDYADIYPKLVRCLAFMLETLRFYPPVNHVVRESNASRSITCHEVTPPFLTTTKKTQNIRGNKPKTHHQISAGTAIWINTVAMNLDPENWGSDAKAFRPNRWIQPTTNPTTSPLENSSPSSESVLPPPKNSFMAWSAGPRQCPGQKMSQVEFVSVFATILGNHRIEAVPLQEMNISVPGTKKPSLSKESPEELKTRIHRVMTDSQPRVALQMNHPEHVWIRFVPRHAAGSK